jgi:hypothetical protein
MVLGSCSGESSIAIVTTQALLPAMQAYAAALPSKRVTVTASDDPMSALHGGATLEVAVLDDLAGCTECFRVDKAAGGRRGFVVHGDGVLGAEYGLSDLLEAAGFRFHRPLHPAAPGSLSAPAPGRIGAQHAAEKKLRGLHLHTLHPIEGYFSHWADGPLDDAQRIHAWLVENRGNYIEWVALADITRDAARADAWRARTRALVADAHLRGLSVGIGVELFRASDLQNGFNLVDTDPTMVGDPTAEIDARLGLLSGLGFDVVDVSFGEFTAIDPSGFVNALDVASAEIQRLLGARVSATIHVGGLPSQQVSYMGQMLQYYFLVKFADPSIDPWIHTVMYFDLFESTAGAYDVPDFFDHRDYVFDRLRAGQSVAYYPETAYWVSFDDSVPSYLPLYVRSRWLDLAQIRAAAQAGGFADLDEQVQFSSGFEWGYWQQDRITLRMAYELPESWEETFVELFPSALAVDIVALANAEHDALIGRALAAYLAGRDAYTDLGDQLGIHSQPSRPSFASIVALDAGGVAAFATSVLQPLDAFATQLESIDASASRHADVADAEQAEVKDGIAIDAARARFIQALYAAAVAQAGGDHSPPSLEVARARLASAQKIVARRHATIPPLYTQDGEGGATIYPFGYLQQADTLCYWQRELLELENALGQSSDMPPGCIF